MKSFSLIEDVLSDKAIRKWISEPAVTAMYVSAGNDTKSFTFLHPEFLKQRNISDQDAAPNVFSISIKRTLTQR